MKRKEKIKTKPKKMTTLSPFEQLQQVETFFRNEINTRDYALFLSLIYSENVMEEILHMKVSQRNTLLTESKKTKQMISRLIKAKGLKENDFLFQSTYSKSQNKPISRVHIYKTMKEVFAHLKMAPYTVTELRDIIKQGE